MEPVCQAKPARDASSNSDTSDANLNSTAEPDRTLRGAPTELLGADGIAPGSHDCKHLVELFEHCFHAEFNTRLVPGGVEPEYLPASADGATARIVFTHDYYASALHEIAHWCVAGAERRRLHDYGYWYAPDGRSAAQQAEFERVEVKPQAMEWLFAEAAGYRFRVSADNLSQGLGASGTFKQAVAAQAQRYFLNGLPRRANIFYRALVALYGTSPACERLDAARL